MISGLPTVSLKRIRIPTHYVVPTMLGIGVMTAFFTTAPWPTLIFVGAVYVGSIPLTIRASYRLRRTHQAGQARPPQPDEVPTTLPAAPALPVGQESPPAGEWRH